jgi:hypothetical protein
VVVDWTDEFDRWHDHAEKQGGRLLTVAVALLQALTDLPAKPAEESATFKRVRQARPARAVAGRSPLRSRSRRARHLLVPCRRRSRDGRLIGFDKKAIGDVFYASAAARGEALVDAWLRQNGDSDDRRH